MFDDDIKIYPMTFNIVGASSTKKKSRWGVKLLKFFLLLLLLGAAVGAFIFVVLEFM